MVRFLLIFLLLIKSVIADDLLVERINSDFNNTWSSLYSVIERYNYKTAYLQRCDFALKERNYKTDKYRILFFGEYDVMERLSRKYIQIVPFIPLKIVVIEKADNTLLVAMAPKILLDAVDREDKKIINKWQEDIVKIMLEVKNLHL